MASVLDALKERGFVQQCTAEDGLHQLLENEKVVFYNGFDPTADSLHIGHVIPIMAMAHLQQAGHIPIAIVGGGTALVGDPSGKSEMRQMISREQIMHNAEGLKKQLSNYLDLDADKGMMLDNADWLLHLNYVAFLRDIGRHFRVNEMIKAEGYRMRLEREEGLSFIEFNYQLLQAYDFLQMAKRHNCKLQMGGDDQWGNILAGIDLTRRVAGKAVFGLTFPLLTTARGEKMGKTASGAVWLDPERTSPYDFYQYWVNTDDRDVERFLKLFTFLPLDQIAELASLKDSEINVAKQRLAFEATKLAHGEAEAEKAQEAARAAFGSGGHIEGVPTSEVAQSRLNDGIDVVDLFCETGLAESKSAARRLIQQGGLYVNNQQVKDMDAIVDASMLENGQIMLRSGKKKYHRVIIV